MRHGLWSVGLSSGRHGDVHVTLGRRLVVHETAGDDDVAVATARLGRGRGRPCCRGSGVDDGEGAGGAEHHG